MGPKLAVGSGVVLVLGLDPFPRTAQPPSLGEGERSGYHAERSLLKECVQEAFWSRVLPLSGCLALVFHQAARRRLIASHPTFGVPLRFWALCGIVGFEGGCAMYGDSCANKAVVRLPDSKLVANILQYRNQLPVANFKMSSGDNLVERSSGSESATCSEEKPSNHYWDWQNLNPPPEETAVEDCDVEQGPSKCTYAELRLRNRETLQKKEVVASRPASVYDKLRQQNREEARSSAEKQKCQRKES